MTQGKESAARLPAHYSATDIFIVNGRMYHLGLKPGDLATHILLVGDPGRARLIGERFLSKIELEVEHRGLVSITGRATETGQRISVVTSGMGTPSLEIVLTEILCIFEMDFAHLALKPRDECPKLTLIRVGTSGIIDPGTPVGIPVISTYAVGFDNTGLYYDTPPPDEVCEELEHDVAALLEKSAYPESRFRGKVHPYAAKASPEVVAALAESARAKGVQWQDGVTASASGLFAPQGKLVGRIPPTFPPIDRLLSSLKPANGLVLRNFEMESSFLFHYMGGHGHRVGSVCVGVDNAITGAFDARPEESMERTITVAVSALARLK